jgi:hypothetical protein
MPKKTPRKKYLWDLDDKFHCPVIGTCLNVDDLKRVIRQSGVVLHSNPSDFEIHVTLVHLCGQKCRPSKNLQKLLDKRFSRHLQRVKALSTESELEVAWRQARREADIPGTFWAIITHPNLTPVLAQRLYGEIHMLSHISGMSHRAALGQIPVLQETVAHLDGRLRQNQARHQAAIHERDTSIQALEAALAGARRQATRAQDALNKCEAERQTGSERETGRNSWLVAKLAEAGQRLNERGHELAALKEFLEETRSELAMTERTLQALLASDCQTTLSDKPPAPDLSGQHIVYVGGRASLRPHLRSLVERWSGCFTYHDGGKEDNRAHLEAMMANADMVFCPVDCVSHDACRRVKRCCKQNQVPFVPLRAASVSNFATGLQRAVSALSPPD